jgi:hypothetical protein
VTSWATCTGRPTPALHIARYFATQDYVVLSYSGLGFGGSGCKITLDDPDWDGQAARQLVGFLGGEDGIAYADATAVRSGKLGPVGQLVLFTKVYDVAPDGSESLVHNLIASVRIADPSNAIHITLPAIVRRFAVGHAVRIMLAGGDLNYRAGLTSAPVTVTTGAPGQALNLPVTTG